MTERGMPWMVVIIREGVPDVTLFTEERDARDYFDRASLQWSEAFLAHAVEAPRDWIGTP